MLGKNLDTNTVAEDLALLLQAHEVRLDNFSESVLSGHEDGLSAGELELGSSEGLLGVLDVVGLGADGDEDGADVDTSGLAHGLTEGVSHTGLKSISAGAGEHLVDADNVPGMDTNANMETFSGGGILHVLVGGNTGGFKGFRGDLFLLLGDQMHAAGESFPAGLLLASVINTHLGVGHTTVEARLRVGLVLLVSVATSGSSSHFYKIITNLNQEYKQQTNSI